MRARKSNIALDKAYVECMTIKGKRGMLSVSDDIHIVRVCIQTPKANVIMDERIFAKAADAIARFNDLAQLFGGEKK